MNKTICRNCIHYNAYYRQRNCSYEKLSYGICSILQQEHKQNENCGSFKHDELKEKRRNESLYFALECAAKSIKDIIHIIKEQEK